MKGKIKVFQKGVKVLKEEGIVVFSKKLFNFLKERLFRVFLPYFIVFKTTPLWGGWELY